MLGLREAVVAIARAWEMQSVAGCLVQAFGGSADCSAAMDALCPAPVPEAFAGLDASDIEGWKEIVERATKGIFFVYQVVDAHTWEGRCLCGQWDSENHNDGQNMSRM